MLYQAIAQCKAYHYSLPDPVTPNFTIRLQVHGLVKKKCKFTQTLPQSELQTCLFSEAQRKEIGRRGAPAFEALLMDKSVCSISAH
jgi:hypothetical protein